MRAANAEPLTLPSYPRGAPTAHAEGVCLTPEVVREDDGSSTAATLMPALPQAGMWAACAVSALAAAYTIEVQAEDSRRLQRVVDLSSQYQIPFDLSLRGDCESDRRQPSLA